MIVKRLAQWSLSNNRRWKICPLQFRNRQNSKPQHYSIMTLSRVSIAVLTRDIDVAIMSVRLPCSGIVPKGLNIIIFIARQPTDSRYWYNNSVCPSVSLSVCLSVRDVPVSDKNRLTYRHSFFSPYGSPIILVLPASNIFTKLRR